MKMKRPFLLFLPFLLFVAGAFVACEEVEEVGKYDNWQPRNEAFIDSIKAETGDNILATTVDAANKMETGKLYAIPVSGGSYPSQYIYCKKLVDNKDGERPNFSGYHSTVSAYYYGTLITGDEFDGNFDGYGSLDKNIPTLSLPENGEWPKEGKWPTAFDSPSTFTVTGVIIGWTWALQYMRTGERWILYIPWQSGYGSSGSSSGTIPGYSTLTFDIILDSIVE